MEENEYGGLNLDASILDKDLGVDLPKTVTNKILVRIKFLTIIFKHLVPFYGEG